MKKFITFAGAAAVVALGVMGVRKLAGRKA